MKASCADTRACGQITTSCRSLPFSLARAGVGLALVREELALQGSERQEVVIWPHARVSAQLAFIYSHAAEHDPALVATLSALRGVWGLAGR